MTVPPPPATTPGPAIGTVLQERLGATPSGELPHLTVQLDRGQWLAAARVLKHELGCSYFNFLTAVDWKEQGLEVLCRVENLATRLDVTMRTKLPPGDDHCPSLTGIFRGADWMERECYDLLGVVFDGHPDLRRILLGQDWEGHPLRKDYAIDTPHPPYR